MAKKPAWLRKYEIELDDRQRELLRQFGKVMYCERDNSNWYHNDLRRMEVSYDGKEVSVSGTWYGRNLSSRSKKISVPLKRVKYSHLSDRYDSNPGMMLIYSQGAAFSIVHLSTMLDWSESKTRRVTRSLYGPLSLKRESVPVKKRRFKGISKRHSYFISIGGTMKALALGKPFEGRVTDKDVRILSYVHYATNELLDKYGRDQPWRPTFHPKELKKDLKLSTKEIKESMIDMTGLLCFVTAPSDWVMTRKYLTNMWMLPKEREELASEILDEARADGLIVYDP